MLKLIVNNLPAEANEDSISSLFSEFGTVRSIRLLSDTFTGKCRGIGFIEMEGHEARAAIEGLNGRTYAGNSLKVRLEQKKRNPRARGRR